MCRMTTPPDSPAPIYSFMELGAVKPQGWLRDWAVAAKDGYTGHMEDVAEDFRQAWADGFELRGDRLLWPNGSWPYEGGAYWFDGLVRLAWQLDDPELIALAKRRLEPLLEKVGPRTLGLLYWYDRDEQGALEEIGNYDHGWVIGVGAETCRAIAAYHEATRDPRALRTLRYAFDDPRIYRYGVILGVPFAAFQAWKLTGDPAVKAALDAFYADPGQVDWPMSRYSQPPPTDENLLDKVQDWTARHGVVFHEAAISWMQGTFATGDPKFLANVLAWFDYLDGVALQPTGALVCEEDYDFAGPTRGTETCTVANGLYARLNLLAATGRGRFGDIAERLFFNAAPATVSRDFKRHVYFQSPNRLCRDEPRFPRGPGAEGGNYETVHAPLCCTAALNRIVPLFIQHIWMRAPDGLAAALYAPNRLAADVGGVKVEIDTRTSYPFEETIEMTVKPERDAEFTIHFRIPEWCGSPAIGIDGVAVECRPSDGFAAIRRTWPAAGTTVRIAFPMEPVAQVIPDRNDSDRPYVSVSAGPLLFAYGLPEVDDNTPVPGTPTVFRLDPGHALDNARITRGPMPAHWDWPFDSPVKLGVETEQGHLDLIPFGCTKLRISMFAKSE